MSFAKTIECDVITLRTINAKTTDNKNIPYNYTLLTDGNGGTFWSTISTAGQAVGFDSLFIDGVPYTAASAGRVLNINSGPGFGTYSQGSNAVGFFAKAFQTVQVKGGNAIQAYTNDTYPVLNIDTQDGISVVANPDTHTLTFRSGPIPSISTGVYAFSRVETFSNVSSISSGIFSNTSVRTTIDALNVSTPIRFVGLGDIILNTDYTNNGIYVGISSFTSAGYSTLQGTAYSAFSRTMSSVSSLFTDLSTFRRSVSTLDANTSNLSTALISQSNDILNIIMQYTLTSEFYPLSSFVGVFYQSTFAFTSSIQGTIPGNLGYDVDFKTATNGVFFSSARFSLNFLSSKQSQLRNAWAELQYSPSFLFGHLGGPNSEVINISTYVMIGGNVVNESIFNRSWFPNNMSGSNMYTDTFTLNIQNSNLLNAIHPTSTAVILHKIEGVNITGMSSLNATSEKNSLIFHIENNQFF